MSIICMLNDPPPLIHTLNVECVTTPPLSLRSCLLLYTLYTSLYTYRLQQSDIQNDPARGKLLVPCSKTQLTSSHTTQSSRMSSRTGSRSKSVSGLLLCFGWLDPQSCVHN